MKSFSICDSFRKNHLVCMLATGSALLLGSQSSHAAVVSWDGPWTITSTTNTSSKALQVTGMKPAGSDTLQYRVHFSLENLSVADHGTYTISFDYFVNDNPDAHNSILTAFNGGTGDDDGPHIGTGAAIGTWLNATNTFTTSGADLLTFDYNASLNLSPDAENADSFDLLFDNFSVIGPAGQIASSGFLDFESSNTCARRYILLSQFCLLA